MLADASITFEFGGDAVPALEVTGPAGLADLGRAAVTAFSFYLYVPLNNVTETTTDQTATGRAYALETAIDHDGVVTHIYGAYQDRYARVYGRWMIAGRRYRELQRVQQPATPNS